MKQRILCTLCALQIMTSFGCNGDLSSNTDSSTAELTSVWNPKFQIITKSTSNSYVTVYAEGPSVNNRHTNAKSVIKTVTLDVLASLNSSAAVVKSYKLGSVGWYGVYWNSGLSGEKDGTPMRLTATTNDAKTAGSLPFQFRQKQPTLDNGTPTLPAIASFKAGKSSILKGESVPLTAVFSNGTGIITPGNIPITSNKAIQVTPSASTAYVLRVTNTSGSVTASVSITVSSTANPSIKSFSATPATIAPGTSCQLSAAFSDGTGIISGIGATSSGATIWVSPAQTTTYELTVTGASGTQPAKQTTTVKVAAAHGTGTDISGGRVSGIWTAANSPYRIRGDIVVPYDSALTIEPGVVIEFTGKYKFEVNGIITAEGTPSQFITFTTSSPSVKWFGMLIDSCMMAGTGKCQRTQPHPAKFSYAIFERASKDDGKERLWSEGGAIQHYGRDAGKDNDLQIKNSIFRDNYAIWEGGAILFLSDNSLVVGCIFIRNESTSNPNYALGSAVAFAHSRSRLLNSTIVENTGIGVFTGFGNAGVKKNNIIYQNRDPYRYNGMDLSNSDTSWEMALKTAAWNNQEGFIGKFGETYNVIPLDPSNLVGINPTFVSFDNNLALQAGSSAINASVDVRSVLLNGETLPNKDLKGNPRTCGGAMDLGAIEYCN